MKSRLYTRTGDDGTTSLIGGRAPKHSLRLEAYGTVDELNSWLGLLAAEPGLDPARRDMLLSIQNTLFDIGASLATAPDSPWPAAPLRDSAVAALERHIDDIDAALPELRAFILPGGSPAAARANVARTVARRAERHITALAAEAPVDPAIMRYINRLSDLLFAFGRELNLKHGHDEIFLQQNG